MGESDFFMDTSVFFLDIGAVFVIFLVVLIVEPLLDPSSIWSMMGTMCIVGIFFIE